VCLRVTVVGVAPQFTEKLHSQRVREGGSAKFVARVSGNPPPEVTWYREGLKITSSPDFIISSQGDLHSLSISEVFREDAGKFTARASNAVGQVQCVADLIVERTSTSLSNRLYAVSCLFIRRIEYISLRTIAIDVPGVWQSVCHEGKLCKNG